MNISVTIKVSHLIFSVTSLDIIRGLPFSTYAPSGGGWGPASYTFPLHITCKKGVGGSR